MSATDSFSVTSLTTVCSTISTRAASSAAELGSLVASIDPSAQHGNVQQLTTLTSALGQLGQDAAQLEQALGDATAVSELLRTALSRSLVACDGATATLFKQLMRLQPDNVDRLDQSFLVAYEGVLATHSQLFSTFTDTLQLEAQDSSVDAPSCQDLIQQAEAASRLATTSPDVLRDVDASNGAASSSQLPIREGRPVDKTADAPPAYSAATTTPTASAPSNPLPPQNDRPASKGFSFAHSFKAFTSALRAKPDPLVSALCQAIMLGDEGQVAGLIAQGANVNGRNDAGDMPLKCALTADQAGAARLLLNAGAKHKSGGSTPFLFEAARVGSLAVAKMLLDDGASVHDANITGQPFFVDVVEKKGKLSGVRFLLEHGANANAKLVTGQAIIANPVQQGKVELVALLLEHGANANAANIVGNPLLAIAIEKGETAMIELLLKNGANANTSTFTGVALLADALGKKRLDIAKMLIAGGADVNAKGLHSQPLLISVIRDGRLKEEEKLEAVRLLLDEGANVDNADAVYHLPVICHAVEFPGTGVVEELLKRGASTKVRMISGQTLLTYTIDVNRRDHMKALLDNGEDVNEVDGLHRTPLTMALQRMDYNLAKILVNYGADGSAKANEAAVKVVVAVRRADLLGLMGMAEDGSVISGEVAPDTEAHGSPQRPEAPPPGYAETLKT